MFRNNEREFDDIIGYDPIQGGDDLDPEEGPSTQVGYMDTCTNQAQWT